MEELDGHRAGEDVVDGLPHRGHPATGDALDEAVAPADDVAGGRPGRGGRTGRLGGVRVHGGPGSYEAPDGRAPRVRPAPGR